ncbi:MAG: response regulator [Pseudomonadota bacterium]
MLKAYLFVASVLILFFAGLIFASSAMFRTEVNFQERRALLKSLQSEIQHLHNLTASAEISGQLENFVVLKTPIQEATDRLSDLSQDISGVQLGGVFATNDADFQNLKAGIENQIFNIKHAVGALLAAQNQTEIVRHAAALKGRLRAGAISTAYQALEKRHGQLRFVETLVVNLAWVLIPVQALIYFLVWKLLISKIFHRQKEIYKELKASKDHADDLAQKAIKADDAKSRFLHHFSHELRTPLNGLIGLTDGLKENPRPDITVTEGIIESAEDLNILVSEMIALSDRTDHKDIGEFEGFLHSIKEKQRRARAVRKSRAMKKPTSRSDMFQNLNILVADDNRTNRLVMDKLVKGLGGTADIVEDGQQAVTAYQEKEYDLLLLDIQMPNKTGLEALEAIRMFETDQNRPPAVALAITANTLERELKAYNDAGFATCLAKPITKNRLAEAVSACLV